MAESEGQSGKSAAEEESKAGADKVAPAIAVIERFGGIRPMAKDLGVAVSTVQGWKERASIPANRHDQIRAAAAKKDLALDPDLLRASAQPDAAVTPPPVIEAAAEATSSEKKPAADQGQARPAAGGSMASRASAASARPGSSQSGPSQSGPSGSASSQSGPAGSSPADAGKTASKTSTAADGGGRRSSGSLLGGLVLGVVLALVVGGAAVYSRDFWLPLVDPQSGRQDPAITEALAGLDARLAEVQAGLPPDSSGAVRELGDRLTTLESAVSQGAGQDPETRAALESLSASLARMTDRLQALEEGQAAAGAPTEALTMRLSGEAARLDEMLTTQTELAARLEAAEGALAGVAAGQAAAPGSEETLMLLAMLQLRDAIRGSGPYEEPLRMLQNLTGEDAELAAVIAPLERRAPAGLPSIADLQAAFPDVARRIAAIELGEEGEGWSAGVLRRLSEAVNLRPVGLVEGGQPTAVAARAEVKLNDGDLAGALEELNALSGAAAEAAAAWRSDAEARIAANQAVSRLGALVSERFRTTADG
ncbi:COG4223 family protein [Pelagibius sp.]|uniref:COG4223 family protein n=1 Tax=Pelagibius sp. TaxID=1931238 RepID=UPI003BAF2FAC